jgi:hypothetical protein
MKTILKYGSLLLPTLALADDGNTTSAVNLNPLGHTDLLKFLVDLLDVVIKIGMVLMVIMFVWTGFQYVTAGGNTTKIATAHKAFMYAVIGAAIVLGAFIIINVLQGTINAVKQ